jgi:hypothetical protein
VLRPIHDGKDLAALEDLFLQERLCQAFQGIAVLGQDALRLLVGLRHQPLDLGIQALGCCLGRARRLTCFPLLASASRGSRAFHCTASQCF